MLDFKEMDLEKAGVETDEKGKIKLNEYLQSTDKDIFVSGDAAGFLKFFHGAELHTCMQVNSFFFSSKKKLILKHFS